MRAELGRIKGRRLTFFLPWGGPLLGIKNTSVHTVTYSYLCPLLHSRCLQTGRELGRGRGDPRASGHTDAGGGSPSALKVGGPAGVDASIPSPGLFHIQGAPCLLLYLALPAYHVGPLAEVGGSAQLQGQKTTVRQPPRRPSLIQAPGCRSEAPYVLQGRGK